MSQSFDEAIYRYIIWTSLVNKKPNKKEREREMKVFYIFKNVNKLCSSLNFISS